MTVKKKSKEHTNQLNVKLTDNDVKDLDELNKKFFANEATYSMLGRLLIRQGIKFYKEQQGTVNNG
jgi:hypothetical protein